MSDPTGPKRSSLNYVTNRRSESIKLPDKKYDMITGDDGPGSRMTITEPGKTISVPPRQKPDATRVAKPEARTPSASERLRDTQAGISKPGLSKVAKGSRQVEANRLADQVRKERGK